MEAECGMIVRSAAGRDKGLFMVILAVEGGFACVADGKLRRISKPKRKNLKHLKFTRSRIDTADLTDKKLRGVIAAFAGDEKSRTET